MRPIANINVLDALKKKKEDCAGRMVGAGFFGAPLLPIALTLGPGIGVLILLVAFFACAVIFLKAWGDRAAAQESIESALGGWETSCSRFSEHVEDSFNVQSAWPFPRDLGVPYLRRDD